MDHYRVLQVRRDAEPEVVEKAYKALSMKYHPDRVAPERREAATERMRRINAAYAVLSDREARRRYDRTLPDEYAGDGAAWERFLTGGLYGLFVDWVRTRG